MTIRDLLIQIDACAFLSASQKQNWIRLIPYLNRDQLRAFAITIELYKQRISSIQKDSDFLAYAVSNLFKAYEKKQLHDFKKLFFKEAEKHLSDIEQADLNFNIK